MLHRLSIQNYAIISGLEIAFGDGLNIITGETGAGKSILVGALGLVLGDRADSSVLADSARKAIVEAVFRLQSPGEAGDLLASWDIEPDTELVLRREVSAAGKSRAFVNDTPVNLSQLQQLAACLVDLHLQFDTQDIGRSDFQREVLDALSDHRPLLDDYGNVYAELCLLRKKLSRLEAEQAAALREQDFKLFLLDELAQLNWKEKEMESLEAEFNMLSHAEQVKGMVEKIYYGLDEGEAPVLRQLRAAVQQMQSLSGHHPGLPALSERMQSVFIELQDIASELRHMADKVQMDPRRLDQVNERISAAQKLVKKHGVQHAEALMQVRDRLEAEVSAFQQRGDEMRDTRARMEQAENRAGQLAAKLHANRVKQVKPLEEKVGRLLQRIGMPNARLKVQVEEVPLREGGMDQVSFLFDANRSGHFEPLHKVASGGELSRLMLSVKSLVAGSLSMPTLIFDEIDSGISGEAARQVGILMKELGQRHQVISITHQPQIAARADHHFYVFKQDTGNRIETQVSLLDHDGHVEAIARMMGGEKPSRLVMENAREMVMTPQ
jgi:DNA repair protein RecN (Recombination protein N)